VAPVKKIWRAPAENRQWTTISTGGLPKYAASTNGLICTGGSHCQPPVQMSLCTGGCNYQPPVQMVAVDITNRQ